MAQRTYIATVKQYFRFNGEEIRAIVLSAVLLGLIIGFNDGRPQLILGLWLRNYINSVLIIALVMIVHIGAQKLSALRVGLNVEFKTWTVGIVLGLVLMLVSRGRLWFLAPGGIIVYHMAGLRIGYFRYGLNYYVQGMIAFIGPLANLIIATILKNIQIYMSFLPINFVLVERFFVISLIYACFSLLPIPPLDGALLFFASRMTYMFIFGGFLGYTVFVYFFGIYSYLLALVVAVVIWVLFYIVFERGAWSGT